MCEARLCTGQHSLSLLSTAFYCQTASESTDPIDHPDKVSNGYSHTDKIHIQQVHRHGYGAALQSESRPPQEETLKAATHLWHGLMNASLFSDCYGSSSRGGGQTAVNRQLAVQRQNRKAGSPLQLCSHENQSVLSLWRAPRIKE